jgi:hypothetical protein
VDGAQLELVVNPGQWLHEGDSLLVFVPQGSKDTPGSLAPLFGGSPHPAVLPLSPVLGARWGLRALLDPDADPPRAWAHSNSVWTLPWFPRDPMHEAEGFLPDGPHELILRIDLRARHVGVMEQVDQLVARYRARAVVQFDLSVADDVRLRRNLYPTYLRILDADEASASSKEICDVLWPKQSDTPQRLTKARKRAEALRDGDYLSLLFCV